MGPLAHSPARVIARLLADLGIAALPTASPSPEWSAYSPDMPDKPDSAIAVAGTDGKDNGRRMIDGARPEMHGVQVMVRAFGADAAFAKARAVAVALDAVWMAQASIDPALYLVQQVSRRGDVIHVGREAEASKRHLFSINALVVLKQLL